MFAVLKNAELAGKKGGISKNIKKKRNSPSEIEEERKKKKKRFIHFRKKRREGQNRPERKGSRDPWLAEGKKKEKTKGGRRGKREKRKKNRWEQEKK